MVVRQKVVTLRSGGHLRVVPGGRSAPEGSQGETADLGHDDLGHPDLGHPDLGPDLKARRHAEGELLDAFERGSRDAAGQLYDHLAPVVHRTLLQVLGGRAHDHDDLVQSAFEQIIVTLVRRRFARACSLKSWAASISANVGFNAIRSRRRERKVLDTSAAVDFDRHQSPDGVDVERQAGARREMDRVRGVLCSMDQKKATTVFLHDVAGHDLAEIAVLTDVSVAAAQSRLVRGRQELHERLRSASGSPASRKAGPHG